MTRRGFDVSRFQSAIHRHGLMRNNKFLVRFPYPIGFKDKQALQNTSGHLELWCEGTNIPGVSLMTSEVRRYGYGNIEKKPYNVIMNDVNMSFLSDADGKIWTYFQQWMRMICNYDVRNTMHASAKDGILEDQHPYELAYKYEYAVDIDLIVYDEHGHKSLEIVMREAYPTFVGDIQLNWQDTNNIARIPVTFTMFDWYNKGATSKNTGGGKGKDDDHGGKDKNKDLDTIFGNDNSHT